LTGPSKQQQAQFSPDGRFVACGSDQSGGWEPDAKRFLLLVNVGSDQAPPLDVIINWLPLLKN